MEVIEKRQARRVTVSLNAERISGDESHAIFIENISENGLHIVTAPADGTTEFAPGTMVKVKFTLSPDEILNLYCRVIWSHNSLPEDETCSVGMEILAAPLRYRKFVQQLS